jgi:hypothetical protein
MAQGYSSTAAWEAVNAGAGSTFGAGAAGALGAGAASSLGSLASYALPASNLLGGYLSSQGAQDAASTAANAANRSADLQYRQWQEQQALQAPWRQAGVNALNKMQGGEFAQPDAFKFGASEFNANQDPGYAFRVAEGQKALDRQAAARGGLISGGALKAAARYGQDMGSQEYQNAFNRSLTGYNANVARSDTGYNRLAGLAGVGQTATQQLGAAGQNYATNAGNAITAAGQATAAGQIGAGNTWNNALGTMVSGYQNQNNFNQWLAQQPK